MSIQVYFNEEGNPSIHITAKGDRVFLEKKCGVTFREGKVNQSQKNVGWVLTDQFILYKGNFAIVELEGKELFRIVNE